MDTHNVFKVLNAIIGAYSALPITAASLDNFITLEIIGGCRLDVQVLSLTKAEIRVLTKMNNRRKRTKQDKQCQPMSIADCSPVIKLSQSYSTAQQSKSSSTFSSSPPFPTGEQEFIAVLLHEHAPNQSLHVLHLLTTLLSTVEPVIIMDSNMCKYNNILHFAKLNLQSVTRIGRVTAIFVPIRSRIISGGGQDWQYFQEELDRFSAVCDIYQGHLNLRICAYRQQDNYMLSNQTTVNKLQYFVSTVQSHINSEDELEVLVRSQIPKDCFIHLVSQCAYRTGLPSIKSCSSYIMLNEHPNLCYSFVDHSSHGACSLDQLVIWVLINGQPMLELLPPVSKCLSKGEQSMKGYRQRRDKYQQIRSLLGYTHLVMEHKIDAPQSSPQQKKSNKKQENATIDENESLYCQQSQNSLNQQCSQPENSQNSSLNQFQSQLEAQFQPLTCIVNITTTNISKQDILRIIQSEIYDIFQYFLKLRKNIHQDMQVERQLKLIKRASQILGILQQDMWKIVITDKL